MNTVICHSVKGSALKCLLSYFFVKSNGVTIRSNRLDETIRTNGHTIWIWLRNNIAGLEITTLNILTIASRLLLCIIIAPGLV